MLQALATQNHEACRDATTNAGSHRTKLNPELARKAKRHVRVLAIEYPTQPDMASPATPSND
jgi:hypothetical protein